LDPRRSGLSEPAGSPSRLDPVAAGVLAALLAFTLIIYLPVTGYWFRADDFFFLEAAQTVGARQWVTQSFDFRTAEPVPEFWSYRPLYLLAFKLEYRLFGLDASGYLWVNLVLHLVLVALVWALLVKLTKQYFPAHVGAFIFALHPAFVDPISWVSNGNTPMAMVPYLLALLLFTAYAGARSRRPLLYAGFLGCYLAAVLFHPGTFTLVVAVAAWYFLLHKQPRDALRPGEWRQFIAPAAIMVTAAGIQVWVDRSYLDTEVVVWGPHQFDNLVEYLGLALLPAKQGLGVDTTVQAILGYGFLALVGLLLVGSRRSSLCVFAVIWLFAALGPGTTLILGAFPRLLYMAGPALALLLVALGMRFVEEAPERLRLTAVPVGRYLAAGVLLWVVAVALLQRAPAVQTAGIAPDRTPAEMSAANRLFVQQLTSEITRLEPGSTLYVVGAPLNLVLFDDQRLSSMVRLYYGDIEVRSFPPRDAPDRDVRTALLQVNPPDRVFVFDRSPGAGEGRLQ
jgi:hypothetical protein